MSNSSKDLQEVNSKTLTDIQNLQKIEKDLFNSLETKNIQKQLTTDELNQIVNKINDVSQMRVNLYKSLTNLNTFYNSELSDSIHTLGQQTTAIKIVENELNEAKKRLSLIEMEKNNKIRIVEINNYFGEKYAEQTNVLKTILFVVFLFMVISVLFTKNIIPKLLYICLLIILGVYGVFKIGTSFYSILLRDNMNYQEYNWPFKTSQAPPIDTTNPEGTDNPWQTTGVICSGSACCYDGTTYDPTQNKCVPPPPPPDATDAATGSSASAAGSTAGSTAGSAVGSGANGASVSGTGMLMTGFGGI